MGFQKMNKLIAVTVFSSFLLQACSQQQVIGSAVGVVKMPVKAAGAVAGTAGSVVGGTAGGLVAGNTGRRIGSVAGQAAGKSAVPSLY